MENEINIWSPVVIATLSTQHLCRHEIRHRLEPHIKNIEDIKIRTRNPQVELQGKYVEARIKLDLIAMTEDASGRADLLRHQEIISQRIPLRDFQPGLNEDSEIDYLLQVNDLLWVAEYDKDELLIKISLQYEILALREQLVRLQGAVANVEEDMNGKSEFMSDEQRLALERSQNENMAMARKLHLYETDLKSLRQAIKKAEGRSLSLNHQLQEAQEAIDRLNAAITRKDLQICRYESYGRPAGDLTTLPNPAPVGLDLSLGQRLKRMILSSG